MIKICGIRSLEDALACTGADAIGFNLWPQSKRYVDAATAKVIAAALPPSLKRFAVLVNPSDAEVRAALSFADVLQLHGDESPERAAAISSLSDGRATIVKAVRLRADLDLAGLDRYPMQPLLVDADAPAYGGSGQRADVAVAKELARRRSILLAGGLTADNVTDAIFAVRPFGVDVAGGVESAPGIKDHRKIIAFVARARAALAQMKENA